MAYAMEEETTMMIPPQGMDEDMGEGIASLPEQGNSGIADLPQAAQQLAQLGRAQDTFLGHLEQDEVVIPSELLQASPELEDMIRNAFEAEGMDYSRYVVGSDENSINPETGLPEFNPFKKLERAVRRPLKKAGRKVEKAIRKPVKKAGRQLEKAVRKPIKKVARELKRAAPIVLPIALAATGMGAVAAAGFGTGIGTLVQGGDLKTAIKRGVIAAATAGAIEGITKGIQNNLAPKELAGTQAGTQAAPKGFDLANPQNIAAQTPKGVNVVGSSPDFGTVTEQLVRPDPVSNPFQYTDSLTPPAPQPSNVLDVGANINKLTPPPPVTPPVTSPVAPPDPSGQMFKNMIQDTSQKVSQDAAKKSVERGVLERIKDGYETTKDVLGKGYEATKSGLGKVKESIYPTGEGSKAARDAAMDKYLERGIGLDEAKFLANKEVGYSALRQFGPSAAIGLGGLYYASGALAGGGEQDEEDPEVTAMRQKLAEDRAIAANIQGLPVPGDIDYITAQQTLAGAPNYSYLNPLYQGGYFLNNPTMSNPTLNTGIAMARRGGEMAVTNLDVSKFPRRTGRISGPGTETSDSIPAMLSDGEFVMNARAVRGAGNGSREAGVRKMYDMMRNFESKVA